MIVICTVCRRLLVTVSYGSPKMDDMAHSDIVSEQIMQYILVFVDSGLGLLMGESVLYIDIRG